MKRLILGCAGALAGLQLLCWGVFLRYNGQTETATVVGVFLGLAAVALIACSIRYGVIPGWREDET